MDLQRPSQSSEFRPSAEEAETGRFLELHRQVAWPNSCSSGSVRDPVSKTRKENDESPQAYTHTRGGKEKEREERWKERDRSGNTGNSLEAILKGDELNESKTVEMGRNRHDQTTLCKDKESSFSSQIWLNSSNVFLKEIHTPKRFNCLQQLRNPSSDVYFYSALTRRA